MSKTEYFEGYYIKIQWEEGIIACIPSFHTDKNGRTCAHLQIVSKEFRIEIKRKKFQFYKNGKSFFIQIGSNIFTDQGCRIHIAVQNHLLKGVFEYGALTPLAYDIMGSFRFLPFLQCRHSVFSMQHTVKGSFIHNRKTCVIDHGVGYMEGDRGSDFPKKYFWSQAILGQSSSVMLSVATVPVFGGMFTVQGCIAVIFYHGKEYRMATYLGAKVETISNRMVLLKQGKYTLAVRILDAGQPATLQAPKGGLMKRCIRESIACKAIYTFSDEYGIVFDCISERASMEGEWDEI